MKKLIKICTFLSLVGFSHLVQAADLLEVYNEALQSDPIFQQAIANQLSTKEGLPISISALLPSIIFQATPSLTRTGVSGTNLASFAGLSIAPRNTTTRAYYMSLTINQTLFDFNKFSQVRGAQALAKGADANLNAALEDLMIRTARAYFNVLKDEDQLAYSAASKRAFEHQLGQVREQYNVGLKTVTDVYTAQASYDSALADYIATQTNLNNDRENLRSITGKYYPKLSRLRDDFPLVSPEPKNIDEWVKTAEQHNWSIQAQRYNVENKKQIIRQKYAGHLPVVTIQGLMDRNYTLNLNSYNALMDRAGPGTQTDRAVSVNINFPIFSGGGVIASTNQATYDYEAAQQKLEQTIRDTLNSTRQNYLSIITGISQINADKQAVKSTISSLHGIRASFRVGTETLVDVLNQQQKVFEKQTKYSTDRYNFVNSILALKQAAGTLSFDDLKAVNTWLSDKKQPALLESNKKQ